MPRDYFNFALKGMHPGEFLREEILPGCDLTPAQLAFRLKIEERVIEIVDLIAERRPVTAEIALRLAKLFGNTPEFWLNLQATHDLSKEALANRDAIEAIQTLEVA